MNQLHGSSKDASEVVRCKSNPRKKTASRMKETAACSSVLAAKRDATPTDHLMRDMMARPEYALQSV